MAPQAKNAEATSKKAKGEKEKRRGSTPLFICHMKKNRPFAIGSMQTAIRHLIRETLKLEADFMGRKITPSSMRKSARILA